MNADPLKGLMMNMCAVAGEASIGMRCDQPSSFCSPLIKPSGEPQYLAAVASAANSRVREIAIWISMAAIGARIIINSAPTGLTDPRHRCAAAMNIAIRATNVIAAAIVAAMELVRMSRFLT